MIKNPKLEEHSFLVYGLGISGCAVINFFKRKSFKNFKVWDDKKKNLFRNHRTKNLNKTLKEVDYIILSPGISLIKNKRLKKYEKKIITDIDLFYTNNHKFKSIVVTGTNGKSTTCKLLAHLLKKNNFKYFLGGNIGVPVLNLKSVENSFVIIEVSSFQLAHSKFIKPDYAFFLNFTNDHIDWHGNLKNYLNAKFKIFNLQNKNQFALLNKTHKSIYKKRKHLAKLVVPEANNYKKIKLKINNDYLNSEINDENMSFTYEFSKLIKIKKKSFIESMKSFKGLPHRFEIFLKKGGLTFVNDSKATTFTAAISAIKSLRNIFWILGGLPKKNDKINLLKYKKNIIKCYIIGKNVNFFITQIKGKITFSISKNLRNAIIQSLKDYKSYKIINEGCFILLSPGAASFDQFKNFEIRGNEFKRLSKIYARGII